LTKNFFCLVFFLLTLASVSGIILTARYFDKKRSRANALCLSGTAAGSFTLPMLIQHLFRHTPSLSASVANSLQDFSAGFAEKCNRRGNNLALFTQRI
jgi:hypothetical protein